jgi:flagellar basal-body rod protein FlgB
MGNGFQILERLLEATKTRHGVIASNIANADTPDYKVKDVKFDQMLNSEIIELKKTSPLHIEAFPFGQSGNVTVESTNHWGDRNNVELDMEVAKMTENSLLYQAAIQMLSTKIRMFKNALRRQA